jgi:hypothetical protein
VSSPYLAPNRAIFSIDCTYTYYGNDIYETVAVSSFMECLNLCSTDLRCVAVSYGFVASGLSGCFKLSNTRYSGYSDPSRFVSGTLVSCAA